MFCLLDTILRMYKKKCSNQWTKWTSLISGKMIICVCVCVCVCGNLMLKNCNSLITCKWRHHPRPLCGRFKKREKWSPFLSFVFFSSTFCFFLFSQNLQNEPPNCEHIYKLLSYLASTLSYLCNTLSYLASTLSYFKLPMQYFKLSIQYFKLPSQYFKLPSQYFKLPSQYFKLPMQYLKLPMQYLKLPTQCLKLPMHRIVCS